MPCCRFRCPSPLLWTGVRAADDARCSSTLAWIPPLQIEDAKEVRYYIGVGSLIQQSTSSRLGFSLLRAQTGLSESFSAILKLQIWW
mmetsp:Transcript_102749/g.182548  ORF Transcript_102749/g.182548 Transcript_102749/m.182548 type:complete len:87 (+) Transcript_102749:383-643(+)